MIFDGVYCIAYCYIVTFIELCSVVLFLQLMKLPSYWLLAVCCGGGIGLLSTLVTVLDQLLCPHGYSDVSF